MEKSKGKIGHCQTGSDTRPITPLGTTQSEDTGEELNSKYIDYVPIFKHHKLYIEKNERFHFYELYHHQKWVPFFIVIKDNYHDVQRMNIELGIKKEIGGKNKRNKYYFEGRLRNVD